MGYKANSLVRQNRRPVGNLKPCRAPWVECVERDDNLLILESDRFHQTMILNEVAATIWQLCDGETPYSEIVTEFKKTYQFEDAAEQDIMEMMHALQNQRLLFLGDENDRNWSA